MAEPLRAPVVSVRVTPEQPAIGEAITIEVRVRATGGSDVRFPALPDSLERLEALDPRALRDASSTDFVDRTAIYRVIAFDTGQARVRIGDVTVIRGGVETRHPVRLAPFRIRSVLPADSTGRIPRPARDLIDIPSQWWRLAVAAFVLLALATWGWVAWRRAHRQRAAVVDPAEEARAAFAHARALGLLAAGEPGRHALAHGEILRGYLAARFPESSSRALSGVALAASLPREFPVLPERVAELTRRLEPVAFADAPIEPAEAAALAASAVAIVEDVETAWQARQQREVGERRRRRRRP